jgi:hypothetical protein
VEAATERTVEEARKRTELSICAAEAATDTKLQARPHVALSPHRTPNPTICVCPRT